MQEAEWPLWCRNNFPRHEFQWLFAAGGEGPAEPFSMIPFEEGLIGLLVKWKLFQRGPGDMALIQ